MTKPLLLITSLILALFAPQHALALCGDVTGDGARSASDALAVLRSAVGHGIGSRDRVRGHVLPRIRVVVASLQIHLLCDEIEWRKAGPEREHHRVVLIQPFGEPVVRRATASRVLQSANEQVSGFVRQQEQWTRFGRVTRPSRRVEDEVIGERRAPIGRRWQHPTHHAISPQCRLAVELSHILIHRRDPRHGLRRIPRRRAMPVGREAVAIPLRRIAVERSRHEEVHRERRERGANIVVVGQARRRHRTGSKIAQIPPETSGVFDAV